LISRSFILRSITEEDPIGIYFPEIDNWDEYKPEADLIFKDINTCRSQQEVELLLWRVFVKYFGEKIAGNPSLYRNLAERLWSKR
jgi:hypothetical protein